jgi:hypothetical protein
MTNPIAPQIRATLSPGVAVTSADYAGVTSILATPYGSGGGIVPLWDGVDFQLLPVTSDIALALDATAAHTGYHQSGSTFFLLAFLSGGVLRIGSSPAWVSDVDPGTGAGSAQIVQFNDLWVNANTMNIRYGSNSADVAAVPVHEATAFAAFTATADGQASDSVLFRLLANLYPSQTVPREGLVQDSGISWDWSGNSYQQAHNSALNQVEVLLPFDSTYLVADAFSVVKNSTSTPRTVASGIGIDNATINSGRSTYLQATLQPATVSSSYRGRPGRGRRRIMQLEHGAGLPDTQTWYGYNSGASLHRAGLSLEVWL